MLNCVFFLLFVFQVISNLDWMCVWDREGVLEYSAPYTHLY